MTGSLPTEEMVLLLHEGKTIQLAPQGVSMLPFIKGGEDKVLIRYEEKVRIGDIVLACFCGNWILHRVYDIDAKWYTLMGDGNVNGVELVKRSDIYGTVKAIISPSGRSRKPHRAWFWRNTLADRRILLKIYRKWNGLFANKQKK